MVVALALAIFAFTISPCAIPAMAGDGGMGSDDHGPVADGGNGGEVIVKLARGVDIDDLGADVADHVIARIAGEPIWLLSPEVIDLLIHLNPQLIRHLEYNAAIHGSSGGFFVDAIESDYTDQYAIDRINLPPDAMGGLSTIVAVIDGGVDKTHPVLGPFIHAGGFDFVDNDNMPDDVGNGMDDNGNGLTDELVGHGTFVAGLVHLAAPAAEILPIRVLNGDGDGNLFDAIAAVYHAIACDTNVINFSFVVDGPSNIFGEAIVDARSYSITVIAAAGNSNNLAPIYPAAYGHTLAVAATDSMDRKASFSSFGPHIGISAPGRGIVSTVPGGAYGISNGTSFAAAFVAGAAAQLISFNPDASPGLISDTLKASARNIDGLNPAYAGLLGAGRLDIGRALLMR